MWFGPSGPANTEGYTRDATIKSLGAELQRGRCFYFPDPMVLCCLPSMVPMSPACSTAGSTACYYVVVIFPPYCTRNSTQPWSLAWSSQGQNGVHSVFFHVADLSASFPATESAGQVRRYLHTWPRHRFLFLAVTAGRHLSRREIPWEEHQPLGST